MMLRSHRCVRNSTSNTISIIAPLLFFSALLYHHASLIPVTRGRELEQAFNSCGSALVESGAWLSYDEQMVKSSARSMFSLMRFNKCKSIKHGELEF